MRIHLERTCVERRLIILIFMTTRIGEQDGGHLLGDCPVATTQVFECI